MFEWRVALKEERILLLQKQKWVVSTFTPLLKFYSQRKGEWTKKSNFS